MARIRLRRVFQFSSFAAAAYAYNLGSLGFTSRPAHKFATAVGAYCFRLVCAVRAERAFVAADVRFAGRREVRLTLLAFRSHLKRHRISSPRSTPDCRV